METAYTCPQNEGVKHTPAKPKRQGGKTHNPRRSNDDQCTDFLTLLPAYLFELDDKTRTMLTTSAWKFIERGGNEENPIPPRTAYYMRWSREMLEDGVMPTHELFAEEIHVSKMTVTRIRKEALHQYVRAVEKAYLVYQLLTHMPAAAD